MPPDPRLTYLETSVLPKKAPQPSGSTLAAGRLHRVVYKEQHDAGKEGETYPAERVCYQLEVSGRVPQLG